MKVLDLCTGLGGWSAAFTDRGHHVETLDIDPRFKPTYVADVRDWKPSAYYDIILASPPCTYFSIARNRWGYPPEKVREAIQIAWACFTLAREARLFWVIENPRGRMRNYFSSFRETIYYCAYGEPTQKPTDLWGNYPDLLRLPCVPHKTARSGMVRSPARRAMIPYPLSLAVCLQAESLEVHL